jgi:hypothetical protein
VRGGRLGATIDAEPTEETRMSTVDRQSGGADGETGSDQVDLKLEVVVLPVADADRSKAFYAGLG